MPCWPVAVTPASDLRVRLQWLGYSAAATAFVQVVYIAPSDVPVALIPAIAATTINAAINPYSIAVTPDSSAMLALTNEVLLSMN